MIAVLSRAVLAKAFASSERESLRLSFHSPPHLATGALGSVRVAPGYLRLNLWFVCSWKCMENGQKKKLMFMVALAAGRMTGARGGDLRSQGMYSAPFPGLSDIGENRVIASLLAASIWAKAEWSFRCGAVVLSNR